MKYGSVIPETLAIPKSAFWLRSDLDKRNPFENVRIRHGDSVMDCGAYIGTFAAAAMEQGASAVVCYEAAPKNAAILRKNAEQYGDAVSVVEAALTSGDAQSVDLTLSGFNGAHSIVPSPNRRKSICVAAVNFRRELLRLRPHVLKVDIEGAEYELFDSLSSGDLASVACLFIEFHPIEGRDRRITSVRRFIESEGLAVVSERRRAFVAIRQEAGNG